MTDERKRIDDILVRFYGDDTYSRDEATTDLLKLVRRTHFVHKCPDAIAEARLMHVNPNCEDATRCKPHGAKGPVEYYGRKTNDKKTSLPAPVDSVGYTKSEILAICRERRARHQTFWRLG